MTGKKMREQVNTVVSAIRDVAGDDDPRSYAAKIVRDIPVDVLRWIAVEYLADEVRHERRRETARVERESTRAAVMEEVLGSFDKRGSFKGGTLTQVAPDRHGIPKVGTPERVYWETCTLDGRKWVENQIKWAEEDAAIQQRMWQSLTTTLDLYKQRLRTEWTAELLESTFALPDGSLVTWGDATVDEHKQRYEMFVRNAQTNLEGAARHQEAIDALEAKGAACLNEALAAT